MLLIINIMYKSKLFNLFYLIHILIWLFIVVASINDKAAKINIYYVIPAIYIIHMLPFHILDKIKLKLMDNNCDKKEKKEKEIDGVLFLPYIYKRINKTLEICKFNPMSPQGMLLFGMISCFLKLYPLKKINLN
jgi:hypothetical protein